MTNFDTPIPVSEIESILAWVDTYKLSRCTRKINRDFSDAVLLAEILNLHYPKMLEMHNYPPRNSHALKLNNWMTLNRKVLKKLKLNLCYTTMEQLSNATPGYIERLLIMVREKIYRDEEAQKVKDDPMSSGGSYHEALTDEGNVILIPVKSRINGVIETIQQKVISYNTYISVKEELKVSKETVEVLKQKVEHLDSLLKIKEERVEELQRQLERKTSRRKETETLLSNVDSAASIKLIDCSTVTKKPSIKDSTSNIKLTKSIEKPIKITNLQNIPVAEKKPSIHNIPIESLKLSENICKTISYAPREDSKPSEKSSKVSFNVFEETSKLTRKPSKGSVDSTSLEMKQTDEVAKVPEISSKISIYCDSEPVIVLNRPETFLSKANSVNKDAERSKSNIIVYNIQSSDDNKLNTSLSEQSAKTSLHSNPQIEEPSVQKIDVQPAKISTNNTNTNSNFDMKEDMQFNFLGVTGSKKVVSDSKMSIPKNKDYPISNLIYVNEAAKPQDVKDTSLIMPSEIQNVVYSVPDHIPVQPKVIAKRSFSILRDQSAERDLERVNSDVFEEAESIDDQSQNFEDSEDLDDDTDGLTNTTGSVTKDSDDASKQINDDSKDLDNAACLVDKRNSMGSLRRGYDSKLSF